MIILQAGFYNNQRLGSKSIPHLWNLGYGAITLSTILRPETWMFEQMSRLGDRFLPMIVLTNLPQALLSFIYLTYNALFTCMLLGEEWTKFAYERKTLRVTCPVGKQRSTFWLQLPYSYGVPLLIMSMVLHWLVSLSFFVVRITVRDPSDLTQHPSIRNTNGKEVLTCSWSPIAIITAMILGAILLLLLCLNGCRRYKPGLPLAGSSSAVISAACHRPESDVDAAVLPVRWGSVRPEGPVGHCCFTSFESSFPEEGKLYAGSNRYSIGLCYPQQPGSR